MKTQDRLISIKLSSSLLIALDEYCDAHDTDKSKVVRLALRTLITEPTLYERVEALEQICTERDTK